MDFLVRQAGSESVTPPAPVHISAAGEISPESYAEMGAYYPPERQSRCGVVGIEIELVRFTRKAYITCEANITPEWHITFRAPESPKIERFLGCKAEHIIEKTSSLDEIFSVYWIRKRWIYGFNRGIRTLEEL